METMMMRPFLFGVLGPIIMPSMAILSVLASAYTPPTECFLLLAIGFVATVLFVLYATRWVLIYMYDQIRYRPVFGKMRTYDFSEIRSMTPVLFDLLIHVGRRWILVDVQQDWHPLWDLYRAYRKRNGLPIKKKTYRTALGRACGETPGAFGVFLTIEILMTGCAVSLCSFAWLAWRAGRIDAAVIFLLCAVPTIVFLFIFPYSIAASEKHPHLAKWFAPNLIKPKSPSEEKRDKE